MSWLRLITLITLIGVTACGGKEETGVVGTVRGFSGGAVADEPRAARIAADMLSAGGTAADAAVALYFTLTVTLPSVATLGGGGVCVVYDGKQNRGQILDFMPRPPANGGPIAVPSAARGMAALHALYGKLRWEQVVGPAENLARFGVPVSRALAADLLAAAPTLAADPELARIYLSDGKPYAEGQMLVQRDLSTVLSAIRTRGAGELYTGPMARLFVDGAKKAGSAITLDDMRATPFAWRPAVTVKWDDNLLYFPSPPAVAGILEAQIWSMAASRWKRAAPDERAHLFAQASIRAWLDRQRWLADGFKVTPSPPEIVDDDRIKALMASYQPARRTLPPGLQPGREPDPDDAAASAFVVADRSGNAVSCAVTPYGLFGAGHAAPGTGMVLAHTPENGRGPQWLGPMIAVHDFGSGLPIISSFGKNAKGGYAQGDASAGSQFVFAGAASGGAAAASALVEVALRAMIEARPLDEAVDAQRMHADGNPPDTVFVETGVQPRVPGLADRGYKIVPVPVIGRVNAISCPDGVIDSPDSCAFRQDRRGFGLAAGGF